MVPPTSPLPPSKKRILQRLHQISTTIEQSLPDNNADINTIDQRYLRSLARELQMAFYDTNEAIFIQTDYLARTSAIRALLELGIIPTLVEKRVMTATELAQSVNFDNAELIARLLRYLEAENIVYTSDGSTFVYTPHLGAYLTPAGDRWANRYNEFVPAATALAEYLASHGPREIFDPRHTVHSWANGQEGEKLFDIVASTPERAALWNRAMMASEGNSALGMFPWEVLLDGERGGPRALVVDVGGGYGHHARAIVAAHPDFANRIIVQDQSIPLPALSTHKSMTTNNAQPQEPKPTTSPASCTISTTIAPAPSSKALLDFFMLLMGGKERTEEDFRILAQRTGLRVERVWKASVSYQCMVELRLEK